jgi:cytochrome P450
MQFNEQFLLHQRISASVMSPRACICYMPVQDLESKRLLQDFLVSNDYEKLLERFSASIVYTLIFGMRIETGKEPQLRAADANLRNLIKAGETGAWIVDTLPFLNYLPASLAPWKKTAETWYQALAESATRNKEDALKRPGWNWAKEFQNSKEAQQMTDEEIAWDLDIICAGGIETTNVTLQIFTLACVAYPGWIPSAQRELDAVVGSLRLPDFDDLKKLPYIQAVIEETSRWRHITPMGFPHATIKDDYYNGYFIPKGSTVIPLFHAMRANENLFDSPEHFRPERWIGRTQSGNFGYGRRICPGRFIARRSLSIAVARMLWAFSIKPKDGKAPVVDESMFTPAFVSHPKPFDVVFEPRSQIHKEVIEKEWKGADKDVSKMLDGIRDKMVEIGLRPRG